MAEPLAPEGKLDLAAVNDLHMSFVGCAGQDIILDLQNVTHVGALCAQACIAAARSAKQSGNAFQVVNTSDTVLNQLGCMGLTPETIAEGLA